MKASRGIIFDMDGILVDSTEAHYEAWRRTGEWQGTPYRRDFFDRTYGMHNRQTVPQWLGHPLPDRDIKNIADHKERLYREIAKDSLRPIPGVAQFARTAAAAGFQLAVGSSGPRANVEVALAVIGLRPFFRAIACGDDVKEGKPDPAIFLQAARLLGVPPIRCVVIEDAPPGIEAAHRAGMRVIALPTSRHARELRDADAIVAEFPELTLERVAQLTGGL